MSLGNVSIIGRDSVICGNTDVLVDGVKMRGVTKVVLVADAATAVWRAVIHCVPDSIRITDLDSDSVKFVAGLPPQALRHD